MKILNIIDGQKEFNLYKLFYNEKGQPYSDKKLKETYDILKKKALDGMLEVLEFNSWISVYNEKFHYNVESANLCDFMLGNNISYTMWLINYYLTDLVEDMDEKVSDSNKTYAQLMVEHLPVNKRTETKYKTKVSEFIQEISDSAMKNLRPITMHPINSLEDLKSKNHNTTLITEYLYDTDEAEKIRTQDLTKEDELLCLKILQNKAADVVFKRIYDFKAQKLKAYEEYVANIKIMQELDYFMSLSKSAKMSVKIPVQTNNIKLTPEQETTF